MESTLEPIWISTRWRWGPRPWPVFWCQAVRSSELDCGALAALADEHLDALGEKPFRVQLAMSYPPHACEHWAAIWRAAAIEPWWIVEQLVYHEAVATSDGVGQLSIWDPSEATYLDEDTPHSGRVEALRVFGRADQPMYWRGKKIPIGEWVAVP